jgi:hypothetical protein
VDTEALGRARKLAEEIVTHLGHGVGASSRIEALMRLVLNELATWQELYELGMYLQVRLRSAHAVGDASRGQTLTKELIAGIDVELARAGVKPTATSKDILAA